MTRGGGVNNFRIIQKNNARKCSRIKQHKIWFRKKIVISQWSLQTEREGGGGLAGTIIYPNPFLWGGVVTENEGSKNFKFHREISFAVEEKYPLEFTDNFQQVKLGEKLNGNFVALA